MLPTKRPFCVFWKFVFLLTNYGVGVVEPNMVSTWTSNGVVGNVIAFDRMGNGEATFGQLGIGEVASTSIRTIELPLISRISFIRL
jgi:hypothetical protein